MRFTRVPGGGPHEYMDPVTKDAFTNASRLILLKPTGARGMPAVLAVPGTPVDAGHGVAGALAHSDPGGS